MILSNIDESKVGFNVCGGYYSETKNSPSKDLFVQAWQKASCLEDVLDTFRHYVTIYGHDAPCHREEEKWPLSVQSVGRLQSRATIYKKKGVPLKDLTPIPGPSEWEQLAEYARELLEE